MDLHPPLPPIRLRRPSVQKAETRRVHRRSLRPRYHPQGARRQVTPTFAVLSPLLSAAMRAVDYKLVHDASAELREAAFARPTSRLRAAFYRSGTGIPR